MQVTTHSFGKTRDGRAVTLYRMENRAGGVVELLDYGCTVRALRVPDRSGKLVDVVLGYDTIEEYEANDGYLGAVIGQYCNRIGGARFSLDGETYTLAKNDGENHLHGGITGFDKRVWDAVAEEGRVSFSRCSPDGEEGYPGTLYVKAAYTWTDENALSIEYGAQSDKDTFVNLTNHSYFNLAGGGSVLDHELAVYAEAFLENDAHCLPTGRVLPVAGTPFDFRAAKNIGRDIGVPCEQLACGGGYDHNYVFGNPGVMQETAELYAPGTGIAMRVVTTMPGMQVYSANFLGERPGKDGTRMGPREAVCLETQYYPDSPAHPAFPSAVLHKGETYAHKTTYGFFIK